MRHPVRPAVASRARAASRARYGDPGLGDRAPSGWPTHGSTTDRPLPSPGSPRAGFPCFKGTMERCDSLGPSPRASLPSLGDTLRGAPVVSLPSVQSARPRARGSLQPVPSAGSYTQGDAPGPPKFPGNPRVPMPCSSTPAGPHASGQYEAAARPPLCPQRRLPRQSTFRGSMARLGHSLSTLRGVDCSTTTQDSLPAVGQTLRGGIGYPQDSTERFRPKSSSFPGLTWRKPGRARDCSLALPQSRACPIEAPGSSRRGFASPRG